MRPTVLVTGVAGRLGSAVARLFHHEGYDLVTTDLVDPRAAPYRFVRADLRDHAAASALLAGVDVVLHIGNHPGIGSTPPQVVFNENIAINENVFQGSAEQGVGAIVFASTLQLIGSHIDDRTVVTGPRRPVYPLDERAVPDPSNVYALSKSVSEVMLRYYADRCGIACTALRLPLLHRHEPRFVVAAVGAPAGLERAGAGEHERRHVRGAVRDLPGVGAAGEVVVDDPTAHRHGPGEGGRIDGQAGDAGR